ncbi:MAG: NYN domain-containing protein, partial [Flavobacteriaceae bacterium]
MRFKQTERTAIFIDGANLHASIRALGFDLDYRKLLEYFEENSRLIRAFYYTALEI